MSFSFDTPDGGGTGGGSGGSGGLSGSGGHLTGHITSTGRPLIGRSTAGLLIAFGISIENSIGQFVIVVGF